MFKFKIVFKILIILKYYRFVFNHINAALVSNINFF